MPLHPITDYIIGFDLGRDRDHSALAVLALRREDDGPFDRARFVQPTRVVVQLGALRRIPLGVPYIHVIKILRKLVLTLQNASGWAGAKAKVHVVVDSAGPGQVAVELIRAEQLYINLVQTLITAGHEAGYSQSGKRTIPRRELVSSLRYLLESGQIQVHRNLHHRLAFTNEVAAVRPEGGQYAHDDLVIAASLAAYWARCMYPEILRPREVA